MQENYIGKMINSHAVDLEKDLILEWVPSAALAVRSEVFQKLGGFDENLITCEDVDFGYRLSQAGFKILASEKLTPNHYGDPSNIFGLIKKEYWRATDSLILWSKNPYKRSEILTNLYQLWFYLSLLILIISKV